MGHIRAVKFDRKTKRRIITRFPEYLRNVAFVLLAESRATIDKMQSVFPPGK